MPDPFLTAHQTGPAEFDLSNFRPFAIRDQMVRARLFVDRAFDARKLPNRTLLIRGAGVTGVAVATQAALLGVRSVIVESGIDALGRFANCMSRWVEPTHYDWPHDHWNNGIYTGLPLGYEARPAGVLAAVWREELSRLIRIRQSRLYTNVKQFSHRYIPQITPPRILVTLDGSPLEDIFDLMVDCSGPGEEDCRVGDYLGFQFWQTDPFNEANLGLDRDVVPKVLISGAGDGALQDFIRITTGLNSAGALLTAVAREHEPLLRKFLHTAEDQARRRLLWCSDSREKHAILSQLDGTYGKALDILEQENPALWQEMKDRLAGLVRRRVDDGSIIHIAHLCDHLSACYPLNRLVTHLTMRYLHGVDPNRFGFQYKCGTAQVVTNLHTCHSPVDCHGVEHEVTFRGLTCGLQPCQPQVSGGVYNIIIIRHGVSHNDGRQPPKDQMLPFDLPQNSPLISNYAALP